jgi:hypothetical protein
MTFVSGSVGGVIPFMGTLTQRMPGGGHEALLGERPRIVFPQIPGAAKQLTRGSPELIKDRIRTAITRRLREGIENGTPENG